MANYKDFENKAKLRDQAIEEKIEVKKNLVYSWMNLMISSRLLTPGKQPNQSIMTSLMVT